MVSKITQQASSLTGQTGTETLLRNDKTTQTTADKPKPLVHHAKKLDASYEVNLSEAGKAKAATPLPAVNNPEEARRQLDLIKIAAENSAANLTNLHKTNAKQVMDLLA